MSEYKKTRLACTHGPDLHFDGRIVHEFTTQRKDGGKERWTELRLWETPAGNWIAESVGESSRHGDIALREATVIEGVITRPIRISERIGGVDMDNDIILQGSEDQSARLKVMEAFGWTTAAKAFAREMGWQVVRHIP